MEPYARLQRICSLDRRCRPLLLAGGELDDGQVFPLGVDQENLLAVGRQGPCIREALVFGCAGHQVMARAGRQVDRQEPRADENDAVTGIHALQPLVVIDGLLDRQDSPNR